MKISFLLRIKSKLLIGLKWLSSASWHLSSLISSLKPTLHTVTQTCLYLLVHIAHFVYIALLLLLQECLLPQSLPWTTAWYLQNQWFSGQLLWKASTRWRHLSLIPPSTSTSSEVCFPLDSHAYLFFEESVFSTEL